MRAVTPASRLAGPRSPNPSLNLENHSLAEAVRCPHFPQGHAQLLCLFCFNFRFMHLVFGLSKQFVHLGSGASFSLFLCFEPFIHPSHHFCPSETTGSGKDSTNCFTVLADSTPARMEASFSSIVLC